MRSTWTGKQFVTPKKNFDKVLNGEYLLEIYQDRLLGDTVIQYQPCVCQRVSDKHRPLLYS